MNIAQPEVQRLAPRIFAETVVFLVHHVRTRIVGVSNLTFESAGWTPKGSEGLPSRGKSWLRNRSFLCVDNPKVVQPV